MGGAAVVVDLGGKREISVHFGAFLIYHHNPHASPLGLIECKFGWAIICFEIAYEPEPRGVLHLADFCLNSAPAIFGIVPMQLNEVLCCHLLDLDLLAIALARYPYTRKYFKSSFERDKRILM